MCKSIMLKCLLPYANKGSGFMLIKLNLHVNASLPLTMDWLYSFPSAVSHCHVFPKEKERYSFVW